MTIRDLLNSRAMLFETPDDGGSGAPAAPDFDPTPAPTPDPTPAETAAKPWAGSPWAADLDSAEFDDATKAAVHELWQGKVQPYVTQKEQELGQVNEIWNSLQDEDQSVATYLALAEQMYGPEVAQHLANSFGEILQQEGSDADPQNPEEWDWSNPEAYQAWYEAQPPWVQAQEDQRIAAEEDAVYEQEVQQFAPDVIADGTQHIFARYVAASPEGDIQQAKAWYDEEFGPIIAQAKQDPDLAMKLGLDHLHEAEAEIVPGQPIAPNVLGATGVAGGSEPVTVPNYESMDDAYSDFFESVKGTGPHLQR